MGGPALLAGHRADPGVGRPGAQQLSDRVGQDFTRGVVDVGLDEHLGLARRGSDPGRVAQHDLGQVRTVVEFPGTGPEPRGADGHGRQRPETARQRGHEGRSGRGGELHRQVDAPGGNTAQQLDHRRRRIGDDSVGRPHHSEADRDRRTGHLVDTQHLERGTGTHHIDDGIDPAHLVEVDLIGRSAVEATLGGGEGPEHGQSPRLHSGRKLGVGHQALDVGRGANHRRLLDPHVDLGSTDSAPQHRLHLQRPPRQAQPPQDGCHLLDRRASVDQRAQGHVAGDAGEAVEPGRGHRGTGPTSAR